MKNAIDLLNSELDEHKRNKKNLQSEIKRLTCENDKMRKELSRYKGIRKYITGTHNHDDKNPKQPETAGVAPVNDTAVSEELSITTAKLASLRDHMIHIGNSLISAVNDDSLTTGDPHNGSFTKVVSRRRRQLRSGERQPEEEHIPSPTTGGREVQSISVVIGTGRNNSDTYAAACRPNINGGNLRPDGPNQGHQHAHQSTARMSRSDPAPPRPHARQPADHQRGDMTTSPSSTIIIGTSLVRGLGSKLNSLGTRSTTFTYPGRDIPYLRSRLQNIISQQDQPERIIIQCGGNDAERVSVNHVTHAYEGLLSDVRRLCPRTKIILCTIPPRGNNASVLQKIDSINTWMKRRARPGDGLYCIEASPQSPWFFRKDMTHFNARGLNVYAKRLSGHLSNFSRSHNDNGL